MPTVSWLPAKFLATFLSVPLFVGRRKPSDRGRFMARSCDCPLSPALPAQHLDPILHLFNRFDGFQQPSPVSLYLITSPKGWLTPLDICHARYTIPIGSWATQLRP